MHQRHWELSIPALGTLLALPISWLPAALCCPQASGSESFRADTNRRAPCGALLLWGGEAPNLFSLRHPLDIRHAGVGVLGASQGAIGITMRLAQASGAPGLSGGGRRNGAGSGAPGARGPLGGIGGT